MGSTESAGTAGGAAGTTGTAAEATEAAEAGAHRPRARALSPALMVVTGGVCTSSSGMLIKLSEVNSGTAAFLRCALALVLLAPMAFAEYRRTGPRPLRLLALDFSAGALLGLDYVCWVESIHDLGASIATLLINVQLLVYPLLARFLTGARLTRRYWLTAPVLLIGLALAGGAIGRAEPGSDPFSGVLFGTVAGVAFAGYLFLIRLGGESGHGAGSQLPSAVGPEEISGDGDGAAGTATGTATGTARTAPGPRPHTVTPVCIATSGAAVTSGVLGSLWTGVDVNPGWPAWGWLIPMAFLGQVLAWLLINPALPRLTPDKGATLLLLQPVLALLFGVVFLAERPSLTQYVGCVLVVLAVWRSTRTDH